MIKPIPSIKPNLTSQPYVVVVNIIFVVALNQLPPQFLSDVGFLSGLCEAAAYISLFCFDLVLQSQRIVGNRNSSLGVFVVCL